MRLLLLTVMLLLAIPTHAQADENGFAHWLFTFKQRAAAKGLEPQFLSQKLTGVEYLPRVIELDRKQPENKITFAKYKKNIVTQTRIEDGRKRYLENRTLLNRIANQYNVPPQYIVALWGIETNYGRVTGNFDIISSLATLAYEGRRADFFENELVLALRILQEGHAGTDRLIGSWAGAMGQCQFMPQSYMKYAVDGDGDGDVDIWNSLPDIFASIANYLHTEGWQGDTRWGRAVKVTRHIPESAYGRDKMKPLSEWQRAGVTLPNGKPLPNMTDGNDPKAALIAPDGPGNATYLVYGNYNVIMHWNRSTYFATSVGLLADGIAAASGK